MEDFLMDSSTQASPQLDTKKFNSGVYVFVGRWPWECRISLTTGNTSRVLSDGSLQKNKGEHAFSAYLSTIRTVQYGVFHVRLGYTLRSPSRDKKRQPANNADRRFCMVFCTNAGIRPGKLGGVKNSAL
ncbi:hypothetical protein Bbelb_300390 [Branchiostoma belcheri]|nr:hypothetical protein Bbelb_300390 [Branchiostoma belcheri]